MCEIINAIENVIGFVVNNKLAIVACATVALVLGLVGGCIVAPFFM